MAATKFCKHPPASPSCLSSLSFDLLCVWSLQVLPKLPCVGLTSRTGDTPVLCGFALNIPIDHLQGKGLPLGKLLSLNCHGVSLSVSDVMDM